jgi:chromosome segregation ATPase
VIKRIRGGNFQSWKRLDIELHKGVNAIVGVSDSGKTAILRLVSWVTTNKPSGWAFRSNWGGDTFGEIELQEGVTVTRERTEEKDAGVYRLSTMKDPLKKLGQDVPEEVSHALNLSDLNVQRQLDAPFLLSESPAEVARVLNRVVRLDEIDRSMSDANGRILSAGRTLKTEESRAEELEAELEGFAGLGDAETRLAAVEVLEGNRARLERDAKALRALAEKASLAEGDLERLPDVRRAERLAAGLSGKADEFRDRQEAISRLGNLVDSISRAQDALEALPSTRGAERLLLRLAERQAEFDTLSRSRKAVRSLAESARTARESLRSLTKQLAGEEEEFHRLMPSTCPLCGQEVEK